MNSQQMKEEIDRITRLCKEKDAEIDLAIASANAQEVAHFEQLSEAQAQIAMQAEALKDIARGRLQVPDFEKYVVRVATDALPAASETVAAWRAKETEPYKREVAMLRNAIVAFFDSKGYDCTKIYKALDDADIKATALAYDQEVEQRGAVKALEELKRRVDSSGLTIAGILDTMLAELRSANKGEANA